MIKEIQSAMQRAGYSAVLITSDRNRRYATGFPSSAGVVYISEKRAVFLTDFRYIEAAKAKIQDCEVMPVSQKMPYSKAVNQLLDEDDAQGIALEDMTLTYDAYKLWKKNLSVRVSKMGTFMNKLRRVKASYEVEAIVRAQRIAEKAYTEILNEIRPGVTEREIAARLIYLMLSAGAENISFDPIVVSGVNSAKPHGMPSGKEIAHGDFVTMDFGCIVDGYCSDMTRTVAVGACSEEMETVYRTVLEAQLAGIKKAKAGVTGEDIDKAARKVIEKAGYAEVFGHGFGHGVGLDVHEEPSASPGAEKKIAAGSVLTAEPGIYLPGKFGVRIEDMLLIEEDGCTNLTKADKSLIIL